MKVCKNNFDVVLYVITACYNCAFGRSTRGCRWHDIFKKYSFDCGGVITSSLSDIFKL
jgi:hypothetical protein